MTANVAPKAGPREGAAVEPMVVVETAFPEKDGLRRRIAHLWGRYYLVNYHSPEKCNFIVESHFIQVHGNEIVENN